MRAGTCFVVFRSLRLPSQLLRHSWAIRSRVRFLYISPLGSKFFYFRTSEQGYGYIFQEASPRRLCQHFPVQLPCVRALKPVRLSLFTNTIVIQRMIPLWTIPMALVTGNTLIIKPSERDPGAAMIIAELCQRAGKVYFLSSSLWLDSGVVVRPSRWRSKRRPWESRYCERDL